MQKLIITGANGAGKTHVAAMFGAARPDIPVFSFDAVKLRRGWQQKSRPEVDAALSEILVQDAWVLEGGPSLLPIALVQADALLWLDPPTATRALRLVTRPWRNFGKTRPELPDGNTDWPLQQYRFAWRSLRNTASFRARISAHLETTADPQIPQIWRCKTHEQVKVALSTWQDHAV